MTSPRLARLVVYLSAGIAFAALHAQTGVEWVTLHDLISLHARPPAGTRILIPAIGSAIFPIIPLGNRAIFAGLEAIAVLLLLLAFREFLFDLFPGEQHPRSFDLYALIILIPLLFNYLVLDGHYYPYDISPLVFFVAGIVLIIRGKWLLFFILLVFAVLNRETSALLVLALIVLKFGKLPVRKLALLVGGAAGIFLAVRWLITSLLPQVGTSAFETHISDNLLYLARGYHFDPVVLSRFLFAGGLWVLIVLYWKQQPNILKRLYLVVVPFIFLPIVGVIGEVRSYGEMVPLIAAGALVPFAAPQLVPDPALAQDSFFRRNWTWFAAGAIAVLVLFLAVHSLALDRPNLVSNYSFERNVDGWQTTSPKILERSGANAWHGGYSGHVVTTGVQGISIADIPVQPGARYRLSAWVKVVKGAARVQLLTGDGKPLGEQFLYARNVWTPLTVTARIPDNVDHVRVSIDDYHEVSDFFVDLVELKWAN